MSGARVKAKPAEHLPQHAKLVYAIRRRHHWTQKELAGEIGVTRNTVGRWERGEHDMHPISIPTLEALLVQEPAVEPAVRERVVEHF